MIKFYRNLIWIMNQMNKINKVIKIINFEIINNKMIKFQKETLKFKII